MPKKRDYYNSPHTGNLFKNREEMREKEEKSFRRKVLFFVRLILILGIIIGIIYGLIFSSAFEIKKIIVTGTSRAGEIEKIENISQRFLEQKRFFIIPNKNLILFKPGGLQNILEYNFDLKKVEIEKEYPQTLKIKIITNFPSLIWQDNGNLFSVYNDGAIQSQIYEIEEFALPLVSYSTTTHVVIDQQVATAEQIEFISAINSYFNFYFKDLYIKKFVINQHENREVSLLTSENWQMIFNIDSNPKDILDVVKKIIEQKVEDRKSLEYVDLRIEDRVYYK